MNLHAVRGPNFSGRSKLLRSWVGLPDDVNETPVHNGCALIPPTAMSNLSGIAPTVSTEIELLAADFDAASDARAMLEEVGFGYCLPRNPFTLSGGEQVVVSVCAAVAGRPKRLAIDCALEQLSAETRSAVLDGLAKRDGELMIADNRMAEWHPAGGQVLAQSAGAPRIDGSLKLPTVPMPKTIEIVDLTHEYVRGRPVFKRLNMKLTPGVQYRLAGPNGVGKSTLSKVLAGLIRPTAGKILVDGKEVKPWKAPGTLASYSFQDPDLQLFATTVARQLGTIDPVFAKAFGLENYLSSHPLDLSFVLRKRLAIACAVARPAPLLILDEPTIGQDDEAIAACNALIDSRSLIISHSRWFDQRPTLAIGAQR